MSERIPQSTTIRVPLQAYLSSDHVSPATGKTIAITISKNGGAYANPSAGATSAVEIASGSYYVDLSTTDTATLGPLFILGTASGVDPVNEICDVVSATTGGATNLDAAVSSRAATTALPTNFTSLLITAGGIVQSDLQTIKTQSVICAATVSVLASVGTASTSLAQTGDSFARIGSNGSALTFLAPASTALSTAVWTAPPTGFFSATFPSGTIASTTNISTVGNITGSVGVVGVVNSIAAGAITEGSIAEDAIDALCIKADAATKIGNATLAVLTPTLNDIPKAGQTNTWTNIVTTESATVAIT